MIWPFKQKVVEEPKPPKLKEIRFGFKDGMYRYTPAEDITPHEVALMLPLFINPMWLMDYEGWVDDHNLKRHFTKAEE